MFLEASPSRCLVVFDGIEGFSEPALQLVARLIGSIRSGSSGVPRIVLTIQPDGLARLQGAFASARVPLEPWALLEVRPLAKRLFSVYWPSSPDYPGPPSVQSSVPCYET